MLDIISSLLAVVHLKIFLQPGQLSSNMWKGLYFKLASSGSNQPPVTRRSLCFMNGDGNMMSTARDGSLCGPRFLTPVKHAPSYCTVDALRNAGEIANVAEQAFIAQRYASAKVVVWTTVRTSRIDLVAGHNTGWMYTGRHFGVDHRSHVSM